MVGLKTRLLKWALPLAAVLVAVVSVGARSARAQIDFGCSLDYFPYAIPCSDIYPNCKTYVPSMHFFGNCSSYGGQCYGWISEVENDCCGNPVTVYFYDGTCSIAGPQLQSSLGKSADRSRLAQPDDAPSRKEPAGFPRLPQPVYLRECTGDYVLYVAPASP